MRVGIAGIGYWGAKVTPEYLDLAEHGLIDSVSIHDVDPGRFIFNGKASAHTDIYKFIDNVDALHICTNNDSHYTLAKKALENGKHVLVEKPMTTDSEKAYELVELAESSGCILQVGHIFRFSNVVRKVKELYSAGFFGKVYYMKLRWTHLQTNPKADILWDLLPHPIDIINFITGKWPREMTGVGLSIKNEPNSAVFMQAMLDSDIFANVELSWLQPNKERILEIIGSQRSVRVDCLNQMIEIQGDKAEIPIEVKKNNTVKEEALNFLTSITNKKSPFNSSIVGARAVSVIEEAIRSIKSLNNG